MIPGVPGALLQAPLSIISSFIRTLILCEKIFKITSRARYLKFCENVHHPMCVTFHVSCVMCHVSCLCVMCHISGVRCYVSGVRCQVSGVRYQVSGVRCQVSGVWCQVSGVRFFSQFFCCFYSSIKWWNYSVEDLLSTGPTPSSYFSRPDIASVCYKPCYLVWFIFISVDISYIGTYLRVVTDKCVF